MSVVGFDIGTLQSVIAVTRNRGVDIITNEVSNRTTPSMVAFGPKQRYIGEMAKNMETSNFKNTAFCLKRLIGRSIDEVIEDESPFIGAKLVDVNGEAGVEIDYKGKRTSFSATQLYGMYLGKLRDTAFNELKNKVSDVVISVPGWYNDRQRRSVIQACEIANLNCLRLINDYTAAALSYGITKTDLPEDKPRNVVFVDMGYSSFSVSVAAFKKGELTIKAAAFSSKCGGRDLDRALFEHFAKSILTKYKVDVKTNPKAKIRLYAACEKLKKTLSANPVANFDVESIMNDIDIHYIVKRSEFEELITPVLTLIREPVEQALKDSGLSIDDIYAIETVGGSIRVPIVKKTIAEVFGRDLSYTLNQDEAVARGCALQCAILSPVFKVRDFAIRDITSYPISFVWEPTIEDDENELAVFPHNHVVPSTKVLTFYRSTSFATDAIYTDVENLPTKSSTKVLSLKVKNVTKRSNGDPSIVKVKTRLDLSGILHVLSAYNVEEREVEEPVPPKEGETVDPEAEPVMRKVKKLIKVGDLPIDQILPFHTNENMLSLRSLETKMYADDAEVVRTENIKNSLEEYIYDMRSKIESEYKEFIHPSQKEPFLSSLNGTEDWLYTDEGDSATYEEYSKKLDSLKAIGDLVTERAVEARARPNASKLLRDSINHWVDIVSSADSRYDHISREEKDKALELIGNKQIWLDDQLERQSKVPSYEAPVLLSHQINQERENMIRFVSTVMTKPKPMATTAGSTPETKPSTSNTQGQQNDASEEMVVEEDQKEESTNPMDVD
ncbi:hypothetical protein BB560_000412 [Smittium megazygosporum]|uniref:Heat shock protein 70 n=1 Tax=Smittium megazygosporum TaxID=133381 RepID=A0A2T9ZKM4_9FUNG|nr:hypothetical protein BB560_000412 [Smittium megazygosporum]